MDLVRNYPTRMHKITETEPGETFGFREGPWQEVKYYNFDAQGNVFRAVEDHKRVPSPREVVAIVNHRPPSCIIHIPRVTEVQKRSLKALYNLGMRWLFIDYNDYEGCKRLIATMSRPTLWYWCHEGAEWYWNGANVDIWGAEELNGLVKETNTPLDIEQLLKDCDAL